MHAEWHLFVGVHGVVPSAGGKLNDAGPDSVGDAGSCQTGAARVEEANDVAVGDAARCRIVRVYARDLATAMLGAGAVAAEIQLTMQARGRLIGDEHERRVRRGRIGRRKPGRMAQTIRLAEAGDSRGENLDPAARGLERRADWILLEGPQVPAVIRRLRQFETVARPEFREARRREPRLREAGARRLVEMFQPLADTASLGEGLARAEAFREIGEDHVVVS